MTVPVSIRPRAKLNISGASTVRNRTAFCSDYFFRLPQVVDNVRTSAAGGRALLLEPTALRTNRAHRQNLLLIKLAGRASGGASHRAATILPTRTTVFQARRRKTKTFIDVSASRRRREECFRHGKRLGGKSQTPSFREATEQKRSRSRRSTQDTSMRSRS